MNTEIKTEVLKYEGGLQIHYHLGNQSVRISRYHIDGWETQIAITSRKSSKMSSQDACNLGELLIVAGEQARQFENNHDGFLAYHDHLMTGLNRSPLSFSEFINPRCTTT